MEEKEISYKDAIKIASKYFKEKTNTTKISKALENDEYWIFSRYTEKVMYGGLKSIKINKKTGQISSFILPNDDNFKLLEESVEIEIPPKYRP